MIARVLPLSATPAGRPASPGNSTHYGDDDDCDVGDDVDEVGNDGNVGEDDDDDYANFDDHDADWDDNEYEGL